MNEADTKEAEQLLLKHRADEAWRKRQEIAVAWWQAHCQGASEAYKRMTAAIDAAYEEGLREGRRLAAEEKSPLDASPENAQQ